MTVRIQRTLIACFRDTADLYHRELRHFGPWDACKAPRCARNAAALAEAAPKRQENAR